MEGRLLLCTAPTADSFCVHVAYSTEAWMPTWDAPFQLLLSPAPIATSASLKIRIMPSIPMRSHCPVKIHLLLLNHSLLNGKQMGSVIHCLEARMPESSGWTKVVVCYLKQRDKVCTLRTIKQCPLQRTQVHSKVTKEAVALAACVFL